MTNEITTCRIWGDDFTAVGENIPELDRITVTESPRAGGGYTVSSGIVRHLDNLDDGGKAQLTSWLVDQREQGNNCPIVTEEAIEYATRKHRLPVYERAERLLKFLSKQTIVAGEGISLIKHSRGWEEFPQNSNGQPIFPDVPTNPFVLGAMAWSESITDNEVSYLVDYLEDEGWVRETFKRSGVFSRSHRYLVTVGGHVRISEEAANVDSSQVFVAMWFDDSLSQVYDEGIAPAIYDCGFEPKRIDRDSTVDKIDDAIIAEIRRSRFLVADFTHGDDGARGGVYYEAGFAHGRGIPVIFTCRGDMIEKIHFDTRQYAHITWNSTSELRESLRDRILARIGEGPTIAQ